MSYVFYLISIPAAIILGTLMGVVITSLFNILPEKWLQDYGVKESDCNYRVSKRMHRYPEGVVAALMCSAFYIVALIFCRQLYFDSFKPLHILVLILLIPALVLVMMSDHLNRIIPDQFSIWIALCGMLSIAADLSESSVWFSSEAGWYMPVVNKIAGALIGGGALWLIGFLTLTFSGHEGMGQGDMRLLAATGLITGCYGLVVLTYVAIFTAVIFAVPKLISKQRRLRREEEEIRRSPNPQKTRRALAIKKARMHFADDPDYLAFGPFLALGCGIFAVMEPYFFNMMYNTIRVLGAWF